MGRVSELETRLANGEKYIDANPNDANAKALYNRVEAEYVEIMEQEERERDIVAIALDLPPGVRWQRTAAAPIYEQVRVLYHGEPEADNELNRQELWALLRTCDEAKAAMR